MSARHRGENVEGSGSGRSSEGADVAITVLSGTPDAAELAAITAVLTAVAREAEDADALASQRGTGAWARGTGQLRSPLIPGPGAWRGFSV